MDFRQESGRTEATHQHFDFGVSDRFGRKVGARITSYEVDFAEAPPEAYSGYTISEGHYYAMQVSATRNGEPYGASQPNQHFKTIEERTKAIDKYLKEAGKRAVKLEGK